MNEASNPNDQFGMEDLLRIKGQDDVLAVKGHGLPVCPFSRLA